MTSRQTKPEIEKSYGFCFSVDENSIGHGGALSSNMLVDTKRGLVTVFLVQHAGFPGDGGASHACFKQAVESRFS
jgi:hypothetical protein